MTAASAGYLPQEPDRAPGETLHDYLARRTGVAAADAEVQAATLAIAEDPDRYSAAFERWMDLGGADLDARAETVLRDLGLDVAPARPRDHGAVRRPGGPRLAGRDPALALRHAAARRAHQRPRLRRPAPARALRRRAPRRRGDRLPRPRVPRAHGHAGAGDRRDRPHRGRVRRRLGRLPGPAGDRRAPRRRSGSSPSPRSATGSSAASHRQRQWSETGVKKSKGSDPDKAVVRHRAERSEKQASKVRASEKALERLEVVDKPWKRWELQLRFGGGERSGDVTVRLDGAMLRRGALRRSARSTSSSRGASGWRWSARTAPARRRWSTR